MPSKGFFTQGVVVFFSKQLEIADVAELLGDAATVTTIEEGTAPRSGPAVLIEFDAANGGVAALDLINSVWPDALGDPKNDAKTFAEWSTGHFGPFAYPGGLTRATDYAWNWERASDHLALQEAYVRIRISYVFGKDKDVPLLPENYDPRAELEYLTGLVQKLLKHPAAICYFNPNGEVLMTAAQLEASLQFHSENDLPPLETWSNIRLYNLDETWTLMDCVGNEQLDQPDHEAGFPRREFSTDDVATFLRHATMHLLSHADEIEDGHTSNGPGDIPWEGYHATDPLSDPPRRVIRWLPGGLEELPDMLLHGIKKKV
jgi:hypothetical protein